MALIQAVQSARVHEGSGPRTVDVRGHVARHVLLPARPVLTPKNSGPYHTLDEESAARQRGPDARAGHCSHRAEARAGLGAGDSPRFGSGQRAARSRLHADPRGRGLFRYIAPSSMASIS